MDQINNFETLACLLYQDNKDKSCYLLPKAGGSMSSSYMSLGLYNFPFSFATTSDSGWMDKFRISLFYFVLKYVVGDRDFQNGKIRLTSSEINLIQCYVKILVQFVSATTDDAINMDSREAIPVWEQLTLWEEAKETYEICQKDEYLFIKPREWDFGETGKLDQTQDMVIVRSQKKILAVCFYTPGFTLKNDNPIETQLLCWRMEHNANPQYYVNTRVASEDRFERDGHSLCLHITSATQKFLNNGQVYISLELLLLFSRSFTNSSSYEKHYQFYSKEHNTLKKVRLLPCDAPLDQSAPTESKNFIVFLGKPNSAIIEQRYSILIPPLLEAISEELPDTSQSPDYFMDDKKWKLFLCTLKNFKVNNFPKEIVACLKNNWKLSVLMPDTAQTLETARLANFKSFQHSQENKNKIFYSGLPRIYETEIPNDVYENTAVYLDDKTYLLRHLSKDHFDTLASLFASSLETYFQNSDEAIFVQLEQLLKRPEFLYIEAEEIPYTQNLAPQVMTTSISACGFKWQPGQKYSISKQNFAQLQPKFSLMYKPSSLPNQQEENFCKEFASWLLPCFGNILSTLPTPFDRYLDFTQRSNEMQLELLHVALARFTGLDPSKMPYLNVNQESLLKFLAEKDPELQKKSGSLVTLAKKGRLVSPDYRKLLSGKFPVIYKCKRNKKDESITSTSDFSYEFDLDKNPKNSIVLEVEIFNMPQCLQAKLDQSRPILKELLFSPNMMVKISTWQDLWQQKSNDVEQLAQMIDNTDLEKILNPLNMKVIGQEYDIKNNDICQSLSTVSLSLFANVIRGSDNAFFALKFCIFPISQVTDICQNVQVTLNEECYFWYRVLRNGREMSVANIAQITFPLLEYALKTENLPALLQENLSSLTVDPLPINCECSVKEVQAAHQCGLIQTPALCYRWKGTEFYRSEEKFLLQYIVPASGAAFMESFLHNVGKLIKICYEAKILDENFSQNVSSFLNFSATNATANCWEILQYVHGSVRPSAAFEETFNQQLLEVLACLDKQSLKQRLDILFPNCGCSYVIPALLVIKEPVEVGNKIELRTGNKFQKSRFISTQDLSSSVSKDIWTLENTTAGTNRVRYIHIPEELEGMPEEILYSIFNAKAVQCQTRPECDVFDSDIFDPTHNIVQKIIEHFLSEKLINRLSKLESYLKGKEWVLVCQTTCKSNFYDALEKLPLQNFKDVTYQTEHTTAVSVTFSNSYLLYQNVPHGLSDVCQQITVTLFYPHYILYKLQKSDNPNVTLNAIKLILQNVYQHRSMMNVGEDWVDQFKELQNLFPKFLVEEQITSETEGSTSSGKLQQVSSHAALCIHFPYNYSIIIANTKYLLATLPFQWEINYIPPSGTEFKSPVEEFLKKCIHITEYFSDLFPYGYLFRNLFRNEWFDFNIYKEKKQKMLLFEQQHNIINAIYSLIKYMLLEELTDIPQEGGGSKRGPITVSHDIQKKFYKSFGDCVRDIDDILQNLQEYHQLNWVHHKIQSSDRFNKIPGQNPPQGYGCHLGWSCIYEDLENTIHTPAGKKINIEGTKSVLPVLFYRDLPLQRPDRDRIYTVCGLYKWMEL